MKMNLFIYLLTKAHTHYMKIKRQFTNDNKNLSNIFFEFNPNNKTGLHLHLKKGY